MGIAAVLTTISIAFPQLFFYIFGVDLSGVESGYQLLGGIAPLNIIRIYCISFLIYTLNKFIVTYYPSIFVSAPSLVNVIVKSGLIGPLLEYFLLMNMGVLGHAFGAIIMEVGALALTFVFIFVAKKMGKYQGSAILLLPKTVIDEQLDITIPAKTEEISLAVEQIQKFSMQISKDENAAMMMAVASEEIISNIMEYGYRNKRSVGFIDVNLSKAENKLLVRIRDDGVAFDPTNIAEDEEEFSFRGIDVVRKVASDFKYLRILNTNNVIMEVNLAAN